jgi:hypothetical protein
VEVNADDPYQQYLTNLARRAAERVAKEAAREEDRSLDTPLRDLRRVIVTTINRQNKRVRNFMLVHRDIVERFVADMIEEADGSDAFPFWVEAVMIQAPRALLLPEHFQQGEAVVACSWQPPSYSYVRKPKLEVIS